MKTICIVWSLIGSFFLKINAFGSVLWRCIYSVSLTVFCLIGLAVIPQGIECLRLLGEYDAKPLSRFLFFTGLAFWSLAAWYSARLTLGARFGMQEAEDLDFHRTRTWLPRFLAILPGFVLAFVFFLKINNALLGTISAILALGLGIFVWKRRLWFGRGFSDGQQNSIRFDKLPLQSRLIVVAALTLSLVLLIAIWLKPIEVTANFTAPVLLCFAFASWILFGDLVLTYFFKQAGFPSMAAFPLLLFIVCSFWNDNHEIRLTKDDQKAGVRPAINIHFQKWLASRIDKKELVKCKSDQTCKPYPVFLVAAQGGGARAAYWSSMVLAKLQDESASRFGGHVFALSGVSGGSLGSGVFTSLIADEKAAVLANAPCAKAKELTKGKFQDCAKMILQADGLSPLLGYLLYPDLIQHFLPFSVPSFDRAKAIEMAWEDSWTKATGTTRFNQRFDRLWGTPENVDVPSLLLNATRVESGNRVIASNLVISASYFPDTDDLFHANLKTQQMSLSTAIHNSARFAYVNPAGTVLRCVGNGPCDAQSSTIPWGRLIDGGYFENSGMETIRDVLYAIQPEIEEMKKKGYQIEPVILVINNTPGEKAPSEITMDLEPAKIGANSKAGSMFLAELLSPILGLYNSSSARAQFAVSAGKRDIAKHTKNAATCQGGGFCWVGIADPETGANGNGSSVTKPALGWVLARDTIDAMDGLLSHPDSAAHKTINEVLVKLKKE